MNQNSEDPAGLQGKSFLNIIGKKKICLQKRLHTHDTFVAQNLPLLCNILKPLQTPNPSRDLRLALSAALSATGFVAAALTFSFFSLESIFSQCAMMVDQV